MFSLACLFYLIESDWRIHDFQECLIEGDTSSVWHVAKAIHKLEVYVSSFDYSQ
jgi:hypothetical protein